MLLLLVIEARRYRFFDVYRARETRQPLEAHIDEICAEMAPPTMTMAVAMINACFVHWLTPC